MVRVITEVNLGEWTMDDGNNLIFGRQNDARNETALHRASANGPGSALFVVTDGGDGVRATSTDGTGLVARSTNGPAILAESTNSVGVLGIGHSQPGVNGISD